jgi:hypothetical protein
MKNNRQCKDSMMNYIIGIIGITLTVIVTLLLKSTSPQEQQYQDIETELLNEMEIHWDSVNKETEDWTGTTQDYDMLDEDMDCGGNILRFNQIHYDSIPRYNRFTDVPAGTDTIIIVDEILYMMNDNKTAWIFIHPDEHMMWVVGDGDTI